MNKPQLAQLLEPFRLDFDVELQATGDEVIPEQLCIALPPDAAGRERQLELLVLPDEDGVFFLQYFMAFPYAIQAERFGDVARLIARINARLPLVGFGLMEDSPLVFFRCVVPCPAQPLDAEILLHTAYVILFIADQIAPLLEVAGEGQQTYAQCVAQLAALQVG